MDFAGGCGGAARGRASARGACGEEKQRGNEPASAPAPAGVGERVGAGAGRLRRVATSTAHGRHAAGKLCRGRARGAALGGAERGEARAGGWLGQGEAGGLLDRLRPWAEKRSGDPRNKKSLFQIMFSRDFQTPVFKYHFEQENDIF